MTTQRRIDEMIRSGHLSPSVRIASVIAIIAMLGISFVSYFILQANYENQIRFSLFQNYKDEQELLARSIAQNVQSDLNSLTDKLQFLSEARPIQEHQFASDEASILLKQTFDEATHLSRIDGVTLLDENNIIVNYYDDHYKKPTFIGFDASSLPPVIQYTSNSHKPTLTTGYRSTVDNSLKIALIVPVYKYGSGKYIGAVMMPFTVKDFLKKYGNLDDINSQYIVMLDRNATVLTSPIKELTGRNFFEPAISNITEEATTHIRKVLSGQEVTSLFRFGSFGERINTGLPITLGDGSHPYFVFIVTPTTSIYSEIDTLIAAQRTIFYLLQGVIAAAIAISLFFLAKWSKTLETLVKVKTSELRNSNQELEKTALQLEAANKSLKAANTDLESANIQLQLNDKMQKEFVNIAAHELRTPITPIVVSMHLAERMKMADGKSKVVLEGDNAEMILRNAKRLERLATDILTVTRIEGKRFELNKEPVEMNEKIQNIISDAKTFVPEGRKIRFIFEPSEAPIVVQADRSKLSEVLINLVRNAIRFASSPDMEGEIRVALKKSSDSREVIVQISDNGSGIDADVMPRLFEKFVSSFGLGGTGLGLYISKAIVEAHGGRIGAENNPKGKGATFTFVLPIEHTNAESYVQDENRS